MALINQEGVTALVNRLNAANESFAVSMKSSVDTFASNISQKWGSVAATKFAEAFEKDLNGIFGIYEKGVNDLYTALTTNVNNHNSRNDGSITVPEIKFNQPDLSSLTSTISASLPDGSGEGLKDGVSISEEAGNFNSAMDNIIFALGGVKSALGSTNAFSEAEVEALVNKYNNDVVTPIKNIFKDECGALKQRMTEEEKKDQELSSTNQANFGG